MRKRRAMKWLGGLLALGLAVCLFRLNRMPERLLLSRSILVAHAGQFEQYNWQSDHHILLFQQRREAPYPYPWSLEKVDLQTGRRLSYPVIAKQFDHSRGGAANFETSPDGKWLLWSTEPYSYGGQDHDAEPLGWLTNLETGHSEHFPIGSMTAIDTSTPDSIHWTTDSKRFVELDFGRSMFDVALHKPVGGPSIVRSVDAPQKATRIEKRSDFDLQSFASTHIYTENRLVAATVGIYNVAESFSTPPDLVQTSLLRDGSSTQQRRLPLPNVTQLLTNVVFSPQGDRYAIVALVDSHPTWLDTLRRWHIPVRIPSHPQVGIWILTLDGKKQQEVGHIKPERDDGPLAVIAPYHMPRDMRWSPNGKQLGFVYKGDLYRVSTE